MKNKKFLTLLLITLITACTLAPNYKRPQVDVPLETSTDSSKKKISAISWREYFQSPDLQRVIETALVNNRDLRVANINIESAQATHGVVRSNLLPTINAVASETRQGVPGSFSSFTLKKQYRANVTLASYELDFFSRLRSLKKSALEDFLATEQARNVTQISLIAEVVNTYAQLLLDRELMQIAQRNFEVQKDRFKYVDLRYQNGIDSQTDRVNSEALVEITNNLYQTYKKLVKQDENALMLLMGVFDQAALPPQELRLADIVINEEALDLIPSDVLLSRPDIKQAEHELKSANANIGAARAAFFPAITLTGNYGYASTEMANLFDSRTWTFMPQITMPLFTGGRNINNLKLAEARKKSEIAQYEKTIQSAFREVSDELATRQAVISQYDSYEKIYQARKKADEILEARHKSGISSALLLLDTKLALYSAEQDRVAIKKDYLVNLIDLYKVLGGGSEVD